ncbi:hypothetical protein [Halobellus rarus]|uniref:Transporter n=1 Tax=Halobellus rarus TaxID=1126237 RepID=A0ABD6CN33_9EURY|nr:hypothetical protein [Halobellus rarus]
MRTSTKVMLAGGLLFVLPLPGTFIGGAIVIAAGVVLRFLGE